MECQKLILAIEEKSRNKTNLNLERQQICKGSKKKKPLNSKPQKTWTSGMLEMDFGC